MECQALTAVLQKLGACFYDSELLNSLFVLLMKLVPKILAFANWPILTYLFIAGQFPHAGRRSNVKRPSNI
jgi:hypothetical protein